jgi:hypothetical protein
MTEFTEQRNNGFGSLEEFGGGDLGAVERDVLEGAFGGIEESHDGIDGWIEVCGELGRSGGGG